MSLLTTSAASLHQLAAAAALAGPPPSPSVVDCPFEQEQAEGLPSWWSRYQALANLLFSAGWLIEQHTLRTKRHLDQATRNAVRTKDCFVIGAMVTNVISIIASGMMQRKFPEGVRVTATGELSPEAPPDAKTYWRASKVLPQLNRLCVAGAIVVTPLVNFNILKSYRPGTIYRLFT